MEAAERADRLEPDLRVGRRRRAMIRSSGCGRRRIADAAERADRLDRARRVRRSTAAAAAPAAPTRSFSAPSPLTANARVYGFGVLRQRQQRRQRALVLEALQRERDRPPAHARLAGRVEHGGGELRIRLQPHQRVHRQAARRRRRVAAHIVVVARRLRERAGLHDLRDEAADGVGRRRVADEAERFGGAALHERRRIGERGDRADRARALVAEQAERERRHLPDFGIGVGQQTRSERRHAVGEPDAADRERRAAADARLVVGSRRVRSGGGGGGTATGRAPCPRPARPAAAARAPAPDRAARADPRDGESTPSSARRPRPTAGAASRRRRRGAARTRTQQRAPCNKQPRRIASTCSGLESVRVRVPGFVTF